MKKFLKKSSVIIFVVTILVGSYTIAFAEEVGTDDVKQDIIATTGEVVVDQGNNVLKKSKTTKKNYSNTIRVLVTPKQKQVVQKKLNKMNDEIEMLAKVIYREARGESKEYQSAVAWCVLNRVDAKGYGSTIIKVITAPNQFAWDPNTPITKVQKKIAKDVITRWLLEKQGIKKVGRTLPKDYKFFEKVGTRNCFRKEFLSTTYWDWHYNDPYNDPYYD